MENYVFQSLPCHSSLPGGVYIPPASKRTSYPISHFPPPSRANTLPTTIQHRTQRILSNTAPTQGHKGTYPRVACFPIFFAAAAGAMTNHPLAAQRGTTRAVVKRNSPTRSDGRNRLNGGGDTRCVECVDGLMTMGGEGRVWRDCKVGLSAGYLIGS